MKIEKKKIVLTDRRSQFCYIKKVAVETVILQNVGMCELEKVAVETVIPTFPTKT